jgi:hypothetical protein
MENGILKGKDISECHDFYENVVVMDKDGEKYFISHDEILKVLQKHEFNVEKKRHRTWLTSKESKK